MIATTLEPSTCLERNRLLYQTRLCYRREGQLDESLDGSHEFLRNEDDCDLGTTKHVLDTRNKVLRVIK